MDIFSNSDAERILNEADIEKAQSFLIEGADGIGKKDLAMRFACKLLGNENRVMGGSHPDFLLLERKVDEKTGKRKNNIVVDDARKISEFLSLTPAEGNHRVCIVNSIDFLNIAAANSILKILEEPPQRSIIILLSHGGMILPTIRSRCVTLRLRPTDEAEILKMLEKILPDSSDEDNKLLLRISGGSPGLAKKISDHDGLNVSRETLQVFAEFPNFDHRKLSKFNANIAKLPEHWEIFKTILAWITVSIAKETAKGYELEIEGRDLNSRLNDFEAFLEAEKAANDDIKNTEIYNLDKKQVITDIFRRFSACYG